MEAYSTPAPLDRLATLRRAVGHSLEGDGEHPKEVLLSPRCGALPPGLRGTLYRNGPGRFSVNGDRYRHLFDGDGLVSRFEFSDAGVRFRSRFVRTEAFLAETAAGRRLFRSYGTNAPGGALRSAFRLKFKNTANTSVTMHGGRLLALWEGGAPYALDPTTLETEGRHDFDGALGPTTVLSRSMGLEGPFSAHPKLDARTGDLLSFGMEPGPRAKLHLYRVSPAGALTVERTIALPMATFVHDFALTENYAVFLLSSLRLDMARMAMGVSSLLDSIRDSAEGVVPLLVPRDPRKPVCFSRPLGSGFVYHLVSARESQDQVVVDALWLRDFAPRHFSLAADSPLRAGAIPNADLRRIVICKDGGRALSRIIRSEACELPAVSSEDEGYAYVVVAAEEATDIFSAIGRVELATGKLQRRDLWPLIASEPVVCHDAAGREFVALVCTDALEETSVLTLLDARSLATIATFDIPQRLPPSFHGLWVSAGPEPALSSL